MVEFGDHAESIADRYLNIILFGKPRARIISMEYIYGSVILHWEESARSCVIDGGTIDMPIHYLWERDWEEKLIAKLKQDEDERKAEAKKQADIEKRERAVTKREREIAQLAKLKLKYEE